MRLPGARVAVDKGWVKFRNLPAWQESKVRIKKEVIGLAETDGKAVHFSTFMGSCRLQDYDLDKKFMKCKGRFVLLGDVVKDELGSYAAFTDQISLASQMIATKLSYVISRLPDPAGGASDAVFSIHREKSKKLQN